MSDASGGEPGSEKGSDRKRDFERMLDLDRSTLIRDFVDEMEAQLRDIDTAQVALKEIVEAGIADPRIIGQRCLIDQRRAAFHGLNGCGDSCRPCGDRNPNDVATALAQARKAGCFMLKPLALKELTVRVLDGLSFRAQAAARFDIPGP